MVEFPFILESSKTLYFTLISWSVFQQFSPKTDVHYSPFSPVVGFSPPIFISCNDNSNGTVCYQLAGQHS